MRYLLDEKDEEGRARGRGKLEALLDRIPGSLVVTTDPPGAAIEVDGKEVGRAPIRVETKRGAHNVTARLDGRRLGIARVEVMSGEETREFLALEQATEDLIVRCDCPGATVELDGRPLGIGVLEKTVPVLPGRHAVKVVKGGGKPIVQVADVALGKPGRIDVSCATPGVGRAAGGAPAREGVSSVHSGPFPWQWVAMGGGAVLLAGGGVLTWLANRDRSRISGADTWDDGTVKAGSLTRSRALALRSRADTLDKANYALYAAGGAAVVAGLVLWVVLPGRGSGAAMVTATPVEGGALVGATGTF